MFDHLFYIPYLNNLLIHCADFILNLISRCSINNGNEANSYIESGAHILFENITDILYKLENRWTLPGIPVNVNFQTIRNYTLSVAQYSTTCNMRKAMQAFKITEVSYYGQV